MIEQLEKVNKGRQKELDDAKGILMIGIVLIHSFQVLGDSSAITSPFYQILFGSFMVTGACLYLFAMGFGIAYSKKQGASDLRKNGFKLILYQFLSNIACVIAIVIALGIINIVGNPSAELIETASLYKKIWFFYINIFFISGCIYFVLSFFKSINLPLWAYLVVAIITGILSTLFADFHTEITWVNIILDISFKSGAFASFGFIPYIGFTCTGYVLGCYMQTVKDKTKFYKKISIFAGIIFIIVAVIFFIKFPTLEEKYNVLYDQYIHAGLLKLIVSDAAMILMFAFFYFLCNTFEKFKWLNSKVRYISKHISKYYAIHIPIFVFISVFTNFSGISFGKCVILFPIVLFITDLIVKGYNKISLSMRRKGGK